MTIDDQVFREAKIEAARAGTTLSYLVEEALRRNLTRKPADFPVSNGSGGLRPGLSLDSMSKFHDQMEELYPDEVFRR